MGTRWQAALSAESAQQEDRDASTSQNEAPGAGGSLRMRCMGARPQRCSPHPPAAHAPALRGQAAVPAPRATRQRARSRQAKASATGAPAPGGSGLPPSPPDTPPAYTTLSTPVYSLASAAPDGSRPTLNLVTYASPVSLSPRHYALGLYVGTLSWEHVLASGRGVLQILGDAHAPLFSLLGKTSGRDVDKLAELERLGHAVALRGGVPTLAACCGALELEVVSDTPMRSGDHDVVIAAVRAHWPPAGGAGPPLYTGRLRELGLM